MNTTQYDDNELSLLQPKQKPKVNELLESMRSAVANANTYLTRMQTAAETRFCIWAGQSDDGRKHGEDLGTDAFPYEGASDARVRVSEEIIEETVLVLLVAMYRGKASFQPRQLTEEGRAAARTMHLVMSYYLSGPMRREIRNVMALVADWRQAYGAAIVYTGWHTEKRLARRSVTAAELLEWATMQMATALEGRISDAEDAGITEEIDGLVESAPVVLEQLNEVMIRLLTDTSVESTAALAEMVLQYDPEVMNARQVAGQLQRQQAAEYFAAEVVESRPCWEALLPFVDVFFPPETEDIQRARWIVRVEWMTAVEVRAAAEAEGWDEAWTEEVLRHPGRAFDWTSELEWVLNGGGIDMVIPSHERNANLFQVCRAYYQSSTKEGIKGMWHTVVHQAVPGKFGAHTLVDFANGKYPFFDFRRERKRRVLLASKGIAELTSTDQAAIKAQFDSRTDRTALEVSPPIVKPANLAGVSMRAKVRPGGELWETRDGGLRFMGMPPGGDKLGSIEIENAVWNRLARRFGRMDESVPAALTQLHMEAMVQDFFTDLTEVLRMTVLLVQKYMPDMDGMRVGSAATIFSGGGKEGVLNATRDEIAGMYDVDITFDVRELDLEWLREKMRVIAEMAIPLDSTGVIDRGLFVKMLVAAIDPRLEAAVSSPEEAAQSEEMDEMTAISIIVAGEEPPFVVDGQNHALRLDVWKRALARSPRLRTIVESDGQVAKVAEARMKMHEQQVVQEQNKIIGRQGAALVLGGGAA